MTAQATIDWLAAVARDETLPQSYRMAAIELGVLATRGHPLDPYRPRYELTEADTALVAELVALQGARH